MMNFTESYHYYWSERADPRTKDWLLVKSAYQIPIIISVYLYFVLYLGPRYMKNRSPYSLKIYTRTYNLFQIVTNAWVVREYIAAGWFTTIPFSCVSVDYSFEFVPYKLAKTMWWVLILKVIEFTETIVFVLRKKDRQISFLHLYHHVTTALMAWFCLKYIAGGMVTFVQLVNCAVHVVMYTYYLMSTWGPRVQKAVAPLKPFITIIQMVQFLGLIAYMTQTFRPSCFTPSFIGPLFTINVIIYMCLFYNFYMKNYKREKVN